MKKIFIVALLVTSLTIFASFRDIPKGHWAEEYVKRLAEIGIVTGFPDGTYRGDESVTRYQIALLIVRTLNYLDGVMKELLITPTAKINSVEEGLTILRNDIETLKNNVEILQEYSNLIYDTVNSKADKTDVEVLYEEIEKLGSVLDRLREYIELVYETTGTRASQKDVDNLKELVEQTREALEREIEELRVQLQDVLINLELHESDIIKLYELVNGLSDKFVYTDSEGNQKEVNLAELKKNLEGFAQDLSELEVRLLNIENTLSTGLPAIRDIVYGLSEEIKGVETSAAAYTDVMVEQLRTEMAERCDELLSELDVLRAGLKDLEERLNSVQEMLTDAVLGLQEQVSEISLKLDTLNGFVVNFRNEALERIEILEMKVSLLEDQIVNVEQVLSESKVGRDEFEDAMVKVMEEMDAKILRQDQKLESAVKELSNQLALNKEELGKSQKETEALKGELEKSKKESEELRTIAALGAVTGVIGLILGVISVGKVFGWW